MNTKSYSFIAGMIVLGFLGTFTSGDNIFAQEISTRISTRESYVGMPVVLQIQIANAQDYEMPDVPVIDGCDVTVAGTPSQSSQITIINGRRSESRSVTMQYLITPRREGSFEIPALDVSVDGQNRQTRPMSFVATKSETGDLLFVEIEGGKDRVYVGEPLDLKLKIWLKPYQDRENKIKLTEGQMWQCLAKQTSWGSFASSIQEMAENNQRPGGKEVLRDDGQGDQRGYYLYEIEATVYPSRPGQIDASDVQIVVNYPTALGRSRDPFESVFGDSPFGGNSLLQQMMSDDFGPGFGRRLSVTAARPIIADANVDSTEVISVPTAGRPKDYRGAVGRYRILADAEPTSVNAGDPITLRLGIVGDGPMELVQAPPLAEIDSITGNFKVEDQSLAGFVRDTTKVFVTTIRPRRQGITEIPPIPLSFFDPDTESFETAYSDPIAISVNASESLSLDSIVSNSRGRNQSSPDGDQAAEEGGLSGNEVPMLQNSFSLDLLETQSRKSGQSSLWWFCVFMPPLVWVSIVIVKLLQPVLAGLPSIRSAKSKCLAAIDRAKTPSELSDALTRFIESRAARPTESSSAAVGELRNMGLGSIANEVEAMFIRLKRDRYLGDSNPGVLFAEQKNMCRSLVESLEVAIAKSRKRNVRSEQRRNRSNRGRAHGSQTIGLLLLLLVPSFGFAVESDFGQATASSLSQSQRESIFSEANELYEKARQAVESDQADANALYTESAAKYQLLVDSGLTNCGLHLNLANAQLQSGQLGRAIANYRRALRHDPSNRQAIANLQFSESRVRQAANDGKESDSSTEVVFSGTGPIWKAAHANLTSNNRRMIQLVGRQTIQVVLAVVSILFWALLIVRVLGVRFHVVRYAVVPAVLLIFALSSIALDYQSLAEPTGVLVSSTSELRDGDGREFPVVHKIESSEGLAVRIISERENWVQIETESGTKGWLPAKFVEKL